MRSTQDCMAASGDSCSGTFILLNRLRALVSITIQNFGRYLQFAVDPGHFGSL